MSLQFILGGSGTGKTRYACDLIIREAYAHPDVLYYIVVPEQFTLQVQKMVVEKSPGKGILNIDVLSFQRLAYHVFEETGGDTLTLLDDLGKSLILRKLAQQHEGELPYMGKQMKKPGYLDEVKSLLSEFIQYEIQEEDLTLMMEKAKENALLVRKLHDMKILYKAFEEYLRGHYMTTEEVMDVLALKIPESQKLKNSVFLFDGFTGFTPIQNRVLRELCRTSQKMMVTITSEAGEGIFAGKHSYSLFSMSRKMMTDLQKMNGDLEEPVLCRHHEKTRFSASLSLRFLEENLFRYQNRIYEKKQDAIRVYDAASPVEEMEDTIRRIIRLSREEKIAYRDMAVITGDLEEYGGIAERLLSEAGIPFFLDQPHDVQMNPLIEFLRAGIEMARRDYSYESVFRYLRSGLGSVEPWETDLLENYILGTGIRGRSRWKKAFTYSMRGMKEEETELVNQIREKLVNETELLADGFAVDGLTMREYCRTIYEFLISCHVPETLQSLAAASEERKDLAGRKEYEQIFERLMNLLEQCVDLMGEEHLTREEFVQILETGLSKLKIALIPPSQDQLLVGDMERTRLKDVKVLFFVGVNEGNIPKKAGGGGFLSGSDREFLKEEGMELAPDPREQMNIQRFYLYLNLTKPSRYLILSYARSNLKGEAASPAYLIRNLTEMFPDAVREVPAGIDDLELPGDGIREVLNRLSEHDLESPLFRELYSWFLRNQEYESQIRDLVSLAYIRKPSDLISRAAAEAIFGDPSKSGSTRLERYAACAYAHFLKYGMKLSERVKYEFDAADLGTLIHASLELFASRVRSSGLSWRSLTEDDRIRLVEECMQEALQGDEHRILRDNARNAYMVRRCRRILRRTVWALQKQLENGEFEPEGFEVSIGGGRVDRIDVLEEPDAVYVKVIDYKTGERSFDLNSLYHGIQLQLAVYMDSAIGLERKKHPDKEVIPAGIFYYNVKDPIEEEKMNISDEELEKKIVNTLKMNGLALEDAAIARKMDATLATIPVRINKDETFAKTGNSTAEREKMELLVRFVEEKVRTFRDGMRSGNADMSPYRLDQKTPCQYCEFAQSCGFDPKIPGNEYRRLEKYKRDEIFAHMKEEVGSWH